MSSAAAAVPYFKRPPVPLPMRRLSLSRPLFSLFHGYPNSISALTIPFNSPSNTTPDIGFTRLHSILPAATPSTYCSSSSSSAMRSSSGKPAMSSKPTKKSRRAMPESVLKFELDMCSKRSDLKEALRLYEDARAKGTPLSLHHYNALLYLCSSASSSSSSSASDYSDTDVDNTGNDGCEELRNLGLERGFEIFAQMGVDKVAPNEATFTSLARLATAKEDPEMAFDLVKKMKSFGIAPKLRSYGPALFGFCKKRQADRAYEVDAHMVECGVQAEDLELATLLKVSVDSKRADKVYDMMHRIRSCVRQVSEDTAGIMEEWFLSEEACGVGLKSWDVEKVRAGVLKGGGGWHGQGWLGIGKWKVVRTQMDEVGVCSCCGEKLVCIDIDPKETENFASSLVTLACEKEKKAHFVRFQEWLHKHGPFDAVIDGANVGLVNQNHFNFYQLNNVVQRLRLFSSTKKLPLVVLHRSRVHGGPALHPKNKKLLESWAKSNALYATPPGSNDDWYWLYAAVCSKCLLVTNDEMRDHLFQLLGNSFFPRWKEKHQVRLAVSRGRLSLHMPPPYSIVIQESENGSWHVPTVTGDDFEKTRQWLCVTRKAAVHATNASQLSSIF